MRYRAEGFDAVLMKKPNKAPEPTPGPVTPRADARSAHIRYDRPHGMDLFSSPRKS
jgi:hypothetical protein